MSTATVRPSDSVSEVLSDLALKELIDAHRASTPGKWEFWRSPGKEPFGHGVLVPHQGRPLLATHFLREEDSRFVALAHEQIPEFLRRLKETRIAEESAKQRLTNALDEARKQVEKLNTDLSKGCEALGKEMEARKLAEGLLKIADDATASARADAEKNLVLAQQYREDSEKKDAELEKLKTAIAKLQAAPPRPTFKRTGKRYLLTNLAHPKQLPFKGAKFDLDVITIDQAQVLLKEGFVSGIPSRGGDRSDLLVNLSNLLNTRIGPRASHVNLHAGDDAVIVSYEGPPYPDGELHGHDFDLWQTYLRWNWLKVVA